MTPSPIDILLVDDNDDDVVLVREALHDSQLVQLVHTACDGEQALAYLRGEGPFAQATQPSLVLLDINMPKMNGLEVLRAIKSDPKLKALPVVMLTTSKREEDILAAYTGGACSFISKPIGFENMRTALEQFAAYWGSVVRVPVART